MTATDTRTTGDGDLRLVGITKRFGRFTAVEAGQPAERGDRVLPGVVVPGLANAHSHAFHRALRGRAQRERGTFWTWREQMYAVAGRLDPDLYFRLARATHTPMRRIVNCTMTTAMNSGSRPATLSERSSKPAVCPPT